MIKKIESKQMIKEEFIMRLERLNTYKNASRLSENYKLKMLNK